MFGLYLPRTWCPQSHVQPLRRRLAVLSLSPDRTAFFFGAAKRRRRGERCSEAKRGPRTAQNESRCFNTLILSALRGHALVTALPPAGALAHARITARSLRPPSQNVFVIAARNRPAQSCVPRQPEGGMFVAV